LYRAVAGHGLFSELHGVELAQMKVNFDPPPLETGRTDRIAKGLEAVIARALARKLDERYEVIDELLTDLLLLRDAVRRALRRDSAPAGAPSRERAVAPPPPPPASAPRAEAPRPFSRWSNVRPWAFRLAILCAGVALGVAFGVARLGRSAVKKDLPSAAYPAWPSPDSHCHVVPDSAERKASSPGKDGAVRLSLEVICDE
jgi:hypothetical protein